jgi:TRAP-type C4-dicarboxylate transport system permease small subunit
MFPIVPSAPGNIAISGAETMNASRIIAILLIVAGVLALAYGGFTYTKETHETKIGPLELSVKDKQTVNIPIWAGVGAIVIGGVLLLVRAKN